MVSSLATALLLSSLNAAPSRPIDVVRQGNDQVQKVIGREDASVKKLADTVDGFVDFGELARRALGNKDWSKLSAKQKAEFTSTMKDLLRTSYAQKAIGQKASEVTYDKEQVKGPEASVLTSIAVKASHYPVEYKLYRSGGNGWRIYDVVTDDVSLVQTYRDQFRRLIASKGYEGLLVTLKSKRDQLEKGEARNADPAATLN